MSQEQARASFDMNIQQLFFATKSADMAADMAVQYINVQPPYQRDYEAWDDKMKTRLIESILVNRRMNPIWVILNPNTDEYNNTIYEVLDGMHRIKTVLGFYNNEYKLAGRYFLNEDLKNKYENMKFNDMDSQAKHLIKTYIMIFNCLDSTFHSDSLKRKDMYEILNRSSKTLNDYEYDKIIYNKFYEFLNKFKNDFSVWSSLNDCRGAIATEMMECLALSENLPTSWVSVNELRKMWLTENLGESEESVNDYLAKNGEKELTEKLNLMIKVGNRLSECGMISSDKRVRKNNALLLKFLVSRIPVHIKDAGRLNRHIQDIFSDFKREILDIDIQLELKAKSRNATFQKKVIKIIDDIICRNVSNEPRCFSKTDISRKLEEQDGKCAMCGCVPKHPEGHHKVEWSKGGKTEYDNLEVLCDLCHKNITRDFNANRHQPCNTSSP